MPRTRTMSSEPAAPRPSFTGTLDWQCAEDLADIVLLAQRKQLVLMDLTDLGRLGARLPNAGETVESRAKIVSLQPAARRAA